MVKVFETGSGKWLFLHDGEMRYTSNESRASVFYKDQLDYILDRYKIRWLWDKGCLELRIHH